MDDGTDGRDWLAARFEEQRPRLRAVAFRMLGTRAEADDAVQESWLRLARADTAAVDNLGGWLTTVVARECLHMLRGRRGRREEPLTDREAPGADPETDVLLADSVGPALLVVLDTLTPAERLAFVLHDTFDVPFDQIAPIVGRSPAATRQLASRARRRVRGSVPARDTNVARQRRVVDAFIAAARGGDFEALLTILDPDVVLRADATASPTGTAVVLHGARTVAGQALAFSGRAPYSRPVLIDGSVGVVVEPHGTPVLALRFGYAGERIAALEIIAAPERLGRLELAELN